MCLYLLFMIVMFTLIPIHNNLFYHPFGISEWLINYQGGFVRRGFIGEILYGLYNLHPYDVRIPIILISVISFIGYLAFTYKISKTHGWSAIPLLFPVACCVLPLTAYRKDFFILLTCFFVFLLLTMYIKEGKKWQIVTSIVTMSLLPIIYEPTFFIFYPVSALILWKFLKGQTWQKIVKLFCSMSLPLICMIAVTLAHGTSETAGKIWNSWNNLFLSYPDGHDISALGESVRFMNRSIKEVFIFHLDKNFGILNFPSFSSIANNIAWILTMFGVYYLVTYVPVIDSTTHTVKTNSQKEVLGSIYIFQCLMMLPMLTVLSCDHGRVLIYCIASTFCLAHLSLKYKVAEFIPLPITYINKQILAKLNKFHWIKSPITYLIVVLIVPYVSSPTPTLTDNIIVHMIDKFCFLYQRYLV